jgi:hypothetical protein
MTTINATVVGGRLEINVPPDWPDGIEVEIRPRDDVKNNETAEMSKEEIAEAIAAMDRIEPFDWSDAERAAWELERQTQRKREKEEFAELAEALRRQWK